MAEHKLEALVRVMVRVPLPSSVATLDDPRDENLAADVTEQRIAAAVYADTVIADEIRAAASALGTVESVTIEEVRE